jgi:hypothetical protein
LRKRLAGVRRTPTRLRRGDEARAIGAGAVRAQIREAVAPRARRLGPRVEFESARSGYRRAYGARKTWKELRRRGVEAGRGQVAHVMCQDGIEGKLRGPRSVSAVIRPMAEH